MVSVITIKLKREKGRRVEREANQQREINNTDAPSRRAAGIQMQM